ncbi:MAG: hypothetical protein AB1568_08810 [Thermodesulfobacteriota bacterium]
MAIQSAFASSIRVRAAHGQPSRSGGSGHGEGGNPTGFGDYDCDNDNDNDNDNEKKVKMPPLQMAATVSSSRAATLCAREVHIL